ncbi:hypothetical protein QRX60_34030 [Amycolatopsis mongoliensis]|uniref:Protein kinase domain-containing protein n=1 Tax=Amycolatopsis mongoliensis TaxID=715475 RepID=A0A9Y2JKH3_9PSEU|nr:hypothetical protein [Amycolatopsis sp. 4-36]WIX99046.1 hypothetical protein QRX60_34030 [Amycolatopsis sp. 4-36]
MTRLARHDKIAQALQDAPDDLLDSARPLGTGIGGSTWLLSVAGEPVFVKRVALTAVELANPRSTADLYGLPTWSHYGVGSAGGGAWRELEAHLMASAWVRGGECGNFPLLHHWRVLPGLPRPRADVERDVAFWHGDPGVRRRLEALAGSTTDLVLFLEYLPHSLARWPDDDLPLEEDLRHITDFLAGQGVQHFDAHFANIVTDGERLYLTDFGLTVSPRFELSDAEAAFLAEHADHDRAYVLTQLVNRVVRGLGEWPDPRARNDFVRACAAGTVPGTSPLLQRYAPLATVVNDFYFALHAESRRTPYPREEIAQQLERAGLPANRSPR